jgi:hypothetical protein
MRLYDPVKNPYISSEAIDDPSTAGVGASMRTQIRVGQIITFALVQGTLIFAGIMAYMVMGKNPVGAPPANGRDTLFLGIGIALALGACAIAVVAASTIRRLAVQRFREQFDSDSVTSSPDSAAPPAVNELIARLQAATLVGQAAMEGAAFANAVLLMLSGNLLHLAVITVMVIGIIWQTPTVGKRQRVIEEAMI